MYNHLLTPLFFPPLQVASAPPHRASAPPSPPPPPSAAPPAAASVPPPPTPPSAPPPPRRQLPSARRRRPLARLASAVEAVARRRLAVGLAAAAAALWRAAAVLAARRAVVVRGQWVVVDLVVHLPQRLQSLEQAQPLPPPAPHLGSAAAQRRRPFAVARHRRLGVAEPHRPRLATVRRRWRRRRATRLRWAATVRAPRHARGG